MKNISECKICKGDLRGPIVGNFFVCDKCGIHYNTIVPQKPTLKQSLSGMMLTACFNHNKMNLRLNNAREQLDIISPHVTVGKLYDVGAAGGFVMKAAHGKGWNVRGNDLSQTAVAWAKRTYGMKIFHGFLEDDPNSSMSDFDLIIFWNTLEHMRDPIADLQLAVRMLRPQGHLHIRVPIKTCDNITIFHEKAHMVEFSLQSLEILRGMNNLEEITKSHPKSRVPCADLLWRKS